MTPARPRFLALLASAAVVAALLVMPAAAGAAGGGDSASGHGLQFGQQIDFSARSTNTGTDARGRIRVTLTGVDPNDVYTAEVTCMRVAGATATTFATAVISGRIVDQPPGQPFLSILVFATDSGKFSNAPDGLTASRSTLPSPPESACPAPIVAPALAEGEVTINNTLP